MHYEIEIALKVLQIYGPHPVMGDAAARELSGTEASLVANAAELINDWLLKIGKFSQQPPPDFDPHILAAQQLLGMWGQPQR